MNLQDPAAKQDIQRVYLEKVKRSVKRVLSLDEFRFLENFGEFDVDLRFDIELKNMTIELSTYITTSKPAIVYFHHNYPENWWQAFKDRWYPRWYLHRWPVKLRMVNLRKVVPTRCCPHVKLTKDKECYTFLASEGVN